MTYDYSTSKAGPISPFAWVAKVAAFAVTQVPSGKIQIGVPNYGRDWVTAVAYTGVTGSLPDDRARRLEPHPGRHLRDTLSYATARHMITSSGAASYIAQWSSAVVLRARHPTGLEAGGALALDLQGAHLHHEDVLHRHAPAVGRDHRHREPPSHR